MCIDGCPGETTTMPDNLAEVEAEIERMLDAPYGYCDLAGCNRSLVLPTAVIGGPYCECCDPDLGMGCAGFNGDVCPPPREPARELVTSAAPGSEHEKRVLHGDARNYVSPKRWRWEEKVSWLVPKPVPRDRPRKRLWKRLRRRLRRFMFLYDGRWWWVTSKGWRRLRLRLGAPD